MPNPLHPAVVHFPIVLLLLGAVVAVASVFVDRWQLAWAAAGLLALGALGCFFALKTGDVAHESVGKLTPTAEALVDAHEEWAQRTAIVGAPAGALAIVAVALRAVPILSEKKKGLTEKSFLNASPTWAAWRTVALGARVLTAVVALAACFLVYQTARCGGELVYTQGVGVRSAPAQAIGTTATDAD